jgi:hypothetical protein
MVRSQLELVAVKTRRYKYADPRKRRKEMLKICISFMEKWEIWALNMLVDI